MPSDRLVTAQHVLRSIGELQRRRTRRVLSELEKLEPDLAEFVIENLSQLYQQLARHGLSHKEAMRIYRLAENTVLVSALALRTGYRALLAPDVGEDGDHPITGDDDPAVPGS